MPTTIYVDADACPVRAEVERVAGRTRTPAVMVSNGGIRPSADPLISVVAVSDGPDAADDWIAMRVGAGDVVVTRDLPLAARCLDAGATVLGPDGREFTAASIGQALAGRAIAQHLRETTRNETRHAAFGAADRQAFLNSLDRLLTRARRG